MKTLYTILSILCLSSYVKALEPLSQYTLTNPCTPSVTIVPIADTYGCYSFTAINGVPNDPDANYTWDFGDNTSATGKTVYHCYSPQQNMTNYAVSFTYQSAALCGVAPTVQIFTINVNPPTICVDPTPLIGLNGYSVTVYTGFVIPEIIFNYKFGDSTSYSPYNSHLYNHCGNYIITVKNWDMNRQNDTCYGYNAVNISCDATTGIKDQAYEKRNELLFPNPVSDNLYFVVQEPLAGISVKDSRGRECYRKSYEGITKGRLELESLEPGVYVLVFIYKDGRQRQLKFIRNNS